MSKAWLLTFFFSRVFHWVGAHSWFGGCSWTIVCHNPWNVVLPKAAETACVDLWRIIKAVLSKWVCLLLWSGVSWLKPIRFLFLFRDPICNKWPLLLQHGLPVWSTVTIFCSWFFSISDKYTCVRVCMFLEGKPVQFKWIVLADKIVNPLFFKKILNVQWNKTEFDLYATVEELGVTEI